MLYVGAIIIIMLERVSNSKLMLKSSTIANKTSGSLGGLATGIFASNFWAKGAPKAFSAGSDMHIAHVVESHLATIWSYFAQPCLFGVM